MQCPNCGTPIEQGSKFCTLCGLPAPAAEQPVFDQTAQPAFIGNLPVASPAAQNQPPKKKKNKKKLRITIISIVLALAIIAGSVVCVYFTNPHIKVMRALENTFFNSSEYKISFEINEQDDDYTKGDISLTLGDDIESSTFELDVKSRQTNTIYYEEQIPELEMDMLEDDLFGTYEEDYYYYDGYYYENEPVYSENYYNSYNTSYTAVNYDVQATPVYTDYETRVEEYEYSLSIKNGKVYEDGEEIAEISEFLEDLEDEFDIDANLEEELNKIINNKIDKDALDTFWDEIIIPTIKEFIEDEFDVTVDIPSYKDINKDLSKIFKKQEIIDAIELKKIDSDLPGTTYKYEIDLFDISDNSINYILDNEQYMDIIETIADASDKDTDEIIEDLKEDIEYIEGFELVGTITIKSNRVTNFTIKLPAKIANIEISIETKK